MSAVYRLTRVGDITAPWGALLDVSWSGVVVANFDLERTVVEEADDDLD